MKRLILSAATLLAAVGCADVAVDDTLEMTPRPSGDTPIIYTNVAAPAQTRLAASPEIGNNISQESWFFRWEEFDKLGAWSDGTATKANTFAMVAADFDGQESLIAPFSGALHDGATQFRLVYPLNTADNTISGSIYSGFDCATQSSNSKPGVGLVPLGDRNMMVSDLIDVDAEATSYAPKMEQIGTFMQFCIILKNATEGHEYKIVSAKIGTDAGTMKLPVHGSVDLSKGIDEAGFLTTTDGMLTINAVNTAPLPYNGVEYLRAITFPFSVSTATFLGAEISYYEIVDGISKLYTASITKIFNFDAEYKRGTHNGFNLELDVTKGISTDVDHLWKGLGTAAEPYLIENEADLRRIAENTTAVGDNFKGVIFAITNDITLTSDWEPIGYEDNNGGARKWFSGYINGAGHSIDNFNINGTTIGGTADKSQGYGFVSSLAPTGTIVNLTIKGGTINGGVCTGAIAGYCHGTIKFCNNYCDINGYTQVGGIAGLQDKKTIEQCKNYGDITGTGVGIDIDSGVGGIVGKSSPNGAVTKIVYAENYGNISGTKQVGGIVGRLETQFLRDKKPDNYLATVDRAYNEGNVTATDWRCGGIAGWNRALIYNAVNRGHIKGTALVGGISGDHCTNNGKGGPNMNLINYGNVEGNNVVGGIVGEARYNLKNVLNVGIVTAKSGMGGAIMGKLYNKNAKIFNSFYTTGHLTATTKADQTTYATNLVAYTDKELIANAQAIADKVTKTYADKTKCTFWRVGSDGLPTIDIYELIINNHNLGGVKGEPKTSGATAYWRDKIQKSWGGGNGTANFPYQISNSNQFARLIVEVNDNGNNFDGVYFILTYNPMGFGAYLWERVGSPEAPFMGMINFNDCSIKNIAYAKGEQFKTDIQDVIYAANPDVQFYGNKETQALVICDRW